MAHFLFQYTINSDEYVKQSSNFVYIFFQNLLSYNKSITITNVGPLQK